MAKNQNVDENLDLLENPEAIADRLNKGEEFVKKNRNVLSYVGMGIIACIAVALWYYNDIKEQEKMAQEEMFQAVFYFEADSIHKALNGDGVNEGFEYIIDEYDQFGFNRTANVAKFYAGVCYMKQGDYETAITYLSDFSSSDLLLQARAYALIGDANMELESYEEAVKYYQKASDYNSNKYFTPNYLMKLAVAQETLKNYQGAVDAYSRIIAEFPEASEVAEAKKYKAMDEGLMSN